MQTKEAKDDIVPDRHFPPFIMNNPLRRLLWPPEKKLVEFVKEGYVAADIGSGPGYYTIPMAKMVSKRGKVYAIDSDERAIERVKEKALRLKLNDVIIAEKGSAADLHMIEDNSVDFVLSNGTICCMAEHSAAAEEMSRIMKPSALAYVEVAKQPFANDPRAVSENEWRELLSIFQVMKEDESIFSRWAVVRRV
ncbi:MAG: class I SAM-dependent methyltransferase [Conexivisphaerales archaeon]